jgi:hypothetical protein
MDPLDYQELPQSGPDKWRAPPMLLARARAPPLPPDAETE